jgi:hypothetical protein
MKTFIRALFGRHQSEPRWLTRGLNWGSIAAFLLLVLSALPFWHGLLDPSGFHTCTAQKESREQRGLALGRDLRAAQVRRQAFEQALSNPAHPQFAVARTGIAEETRLEATLNDRLEGLAIKRRGEDMPAILCMMVLGWILAVAMGRAIVVHYCSAVSPDRVPYSPLQGKSLGPVYFAVAGGLALVHAVESTLTSVVTIDKSWTTWFSFCQTPLAWAVQLLAYAAASLAIAFPIAIAWNLSSAARRPKLMLDHGDRHCGSGAYVVFLQTWTYVGVAVSTAAVAAWLRWMMTRQVSMSDGYLPTSFVIMLCIAIVTGRFIYCGVQVRRDYEKALRAYPSYTAFADAKVPSDPTTPFLGDHWWSLPALIFAIGALFWKIVEWSGLAKLAAGP